MQSDVVGHGLRHLIVIDADSILSGQAEVMGEGARQPLHESVNCANAETAVIVDDTVKQPLGVAFQFGLAKAKILHQRSSHRVGGKRFVPDDFAKFRDDFGLHFVGCGIGESDGKNVPKIVGLRLVLQTKLKVFLDDGVGLPRSGGSLKHFEMCLLRHGLIGSVMGFLLMSGPAEVLMLFLSLNKLRKLSNDLL